MSTKDSPASCRERRITVGEIISAADEHQQVAVPTPWRCRARIADGGRPRGESCRRLGYRGGLGTSLQSPIYDCERAIARLASCARPAGGIKGDLDFPSVNVWKHFETDAPLLRRSRL
jgi:hypothetical protein